MFLIDLLIRFHFHLFNFIEFIFEFIIWILPIRVRLTDFSNCLDFIEMEQLFFVGVGFNFINPFWKRKKIVFTFK